MAATRLIFILVSLVGTAVGSELLIKVTGVARSNLCLRVRVQDVDDNSCTYREEQ
jgi:hypothetical protein